MRHHTVPELTSQELTADYLAGLDCVLISTDHSAYDFSFIVENAPLVIDTRNACSTVTVGPVGTSRRGARGIRFLFRPRAGWLADAPPRCTIAAILCRGSK